MPPDRGDQREGSLRPPPQQIHQPTPRHSRPSLFSLTPISSSSSAHPSPTHSPGDSPDRDPDSASSSNPPSAVLHNLPLGASRGSLGSSPAGMVNSEPRSNGRTSPPPTKSRSILNLTSSTLFGIYSPTGYDANRDEPETPWGSGAQTPALRNGGPAPGYDADKSLADGVREKTLQQLRGAPSSMAPLRAYTRLRSESSADGQSRGKKRRSPSWTHYVFGVVWRVAALFLLGMAYGSVVTRLHDSRQIAPVQVEINRSSWFYLMVWGVLGAALGFLLPWVDERWGAHVFEQHDVSLREDATPETGAADVDRRASDASSEAENPGAEWNPIVRSVGAFVGIAFAIRRLPWQSTLQVSLTLALVNPVIWYLLDRTRTGVALSFLTGVTGATTMMRINPQIVPAPTPAPSSSSSSSSSLFRAGGGAGGAQDVGLLGVSLEGIGVATWLGSVFFCSCVCFGNVGRRLAKGLS